MSQRRRQNQQVRVQGNCQDRVLQAVSNPYYGVDDTQMGANGQDRVVKGTENTGYEGDCGKNETDSQPHPGSSNIVNVKVAENPYYAK